MKDGYPESKSDLFAAFIERCAELVQQGGAAAMITMQSWMFLSSYEKLRTTLLAHQQIISMLHLGTRAFDSIGGEVVSSTAFVLNSRPLGSKVTYGAEKGIFIRLVDESSEAEKVEALRVALANRDLFVGYHLASGEEFAVIPGCPIVYWLSEKMRAVFTTGDSLGAVTSLAVGLQTGDNNRFLRQWWEVSSSRTAFTCTSREEAAASGARWFPYNKGGEFRKWYGNHDYVVNWENDGAEIRTFGTEGGGRPRSRAQNTGTYFSPSVSWSDITSGAPSFRRFPPGFIHGNKGNSLFGPVPLLDRLTGVMNSPCATQVLEALTPTMTASVGDVGKAPIPATIAEFRRSITQSLVAAAKSDWDESEISWDFSSNPIVKASQRTHE